MSSGVRPQIQQRRIPIHQYPLRKFAYGDGKLLVGPLIDDPAAEPYHHIDLVSALLDANPDLDIDDIVIGWLYGSNLIRLGIAETTGPIDPALAAPILEAVRSWARANGLTIRDTAP